MEQYNFILVENKILEDEIRFTEYPQEYRSPLHLAHYRFANGIRLEISDIRMFDGKHYYSTMEIYENGSKDYYFMQKTLQDVCAIINKHVN